MDHNIKDKIEDLKEWVSEHTKIVMPAVLLVCVLITVIIAVNANKKAAEEVESQAAAVAATEQEVIAETEAVPLVEMEENAYPAVNTLMNDYYTARANGDIIAINSMNQYVSDMDKIRIQEMSKYIEGYPELEVYTKTGPVEGSYLVYVYSKVKFTEYANLVPGMEAFYVCTDENGNCYINEGEDSEIVTNYICELSLQDDAVDLNNRIVVEYNELLDSDDELKAFLTDLESRIDVSVGEALAKAEAEAIAPEVDITEEVAETTETAENTEVAEADAEEEVQTQQETTVKTVRATDVVNVRSSDSETADKIGKAQIGDEFTLLEEKGNGWSKITFEGSDAYIKSEFLEVVSEEVVVEEVQTAEAEETETTETQTVSASNTASGTVTVKESVNVRKSASESGEKLGVVYKGEKLEVLMKQADGWTKIKYKGQTAYVKSDYVE